MNAQCVTIKKLLSCGTVYYPFQKKIVLTLESVDKTPVLDQSDLCKLIKSTFHVILFNLLLNIWILFNLELWQPWS